ncbi:MAG: ATP-binding protein [Lachnospiraceae bacterium]|nr:ATP-binding protein [Lachnospiraceae bacterium]MBQ9607666.1 ATP-binding protein [Lachnospiraceae bacterium]MBR1523163.1 ATP-binding protein [Lachnospiraceae bacterium]
MDIFYKDLMAGYERQLAEDKREQRRRIQEIHKRIPRYKELEDKTADLSAEAAIMAASGRKAEAAPLLKELSRISDEKKKVLSEAGVPEGYLSLQYVCPDCKDTGYKGSEKCHCLMQKITEHYYAGSGIYDKLRSENFETFSFDYFSGSELDNIKKIYAAAKEFTVTFADTYCNMLFYGDVGCGKSFMSNCIAKELIDKGIAVIYISAIRLFDILSAHRFDSRNLDDREYEALFEYPLLIIDDLGTEVNSSVVDSELFNVLNERDLKSKSTIISTNLSLAKLKDIYSERSVSRILGNYEIYRFRGDDIRLKKTEVS